MKFYNREKEQELLARTREIAFNGHSQMTALTGRRRIGKTKLILKSCEGTPTVYLFVSRSNEASLCAQSGRNTTSEISEAVGNVSVGGLLQRLEIDYEVIAKKRPVLSKEGTQTVRYEISDNFLRFWFRYIVKNQDLVQAGLLNNLAEMVKADYPTYSGLVLERYFREQLKEKQLFRNIGSWWETSKGKEKEQNEIDIVAIYADEKKAFLAEVKRQRKNFKPELFRQKVEIIRSKLFFKYELETACLTLENM